MKHIEDRGLILIGCGFMGGALLKGWLADGVSPSAVTVIDPAPSSWLTAHSGLRINDTPPCGPAAVVVATKPQILNTVLPSVKQYASPQTVVISIAAGAPIRLFEDYLGTETPIVRAMPNLPASIGVGVSALFGNTATSDEALKLVDHLFSVVGSTTVLPSEDLLHVVTGLSGSGPAYVFALVEAFASAGADLGLPADLAKFLAVRTVAGAGQMLANTHTDPKALREAVTSKGGTTAAGLSQFMSHNHGIQDLAKRTLDAARQRSVDLSIG
ncbi:MAG: pyrroline-5-carboxylate reductase [Pseudomonadota bacterium]